jgi:predicted cupin superfamily sugar epimerase
MPNALEVITALGLQPHPIEGGFFRETYRSSGVIPSQFLPPGYHDGRDRSIGTAIYYLLTRDTFSELHRILTEEVFHFYLGGPVRMLQILLNGKALEIIIGNDIRAGQQPQVIVPAGVWQGSRLEPGEHDFALLGATVTPGFDYADYEQGQRADLIARFPDQAERIKELTRV